MALENNAPLVEAGQKGVEQVNSPLTANCLPRPRVDKLFDQLTRCKLVYVIAGAGCGKTQAVQSYMKQQTDAVVRWLQLSESDNIGTRYWESLTYNIAFDNLELADKLRELGFPETPDEFRQFAEIVRNTEHRAHKTFLVLDDFHLINSKQALVFAERCAYLNIPGACVVIISRTEPEINTISLFAKGMAGMVTEDQLRFTGEEIVSYLMQRGIAVSNDELPRIVEATKGWALAVKLLTLVLQKVPNNLEHALDTMKQNIFGFLEVEAWRDFPDSVKKTLARLSLVSDLPLTPLNDIFDDQTPIKGIPEMAYFMWYDSFIGDYRIHPLYLEFLLNMRGVLTYEEKLDTYRWAAEWCGGNGFYTDAVRYYAKSGQYGQVVESLLSYPFKLPYNTCDYFMGILEGIDPDNMEREDNNILLLKYLFIPLLLIGMGRYEDAVAMSHAVIFGWENHEHPLTPYFLYSAHSNLAYISMYTCTVTHQYAFHEHLKKATGYLKTTVLPVRVSGPFGVPDVRSFACLVGEGATPSEIGRFVESSDEAAIYIAETYHCLYYGYEKLVACELAFYRNQLPASRTYAHNAVIKAREKKQYSIAAMAEQYLLRIAVHEGDYPSTREILEQMRGYLDNPDFWNRQLLYDLFAGAFFFTIGLPELAPTRFAVGEMETTSEVRIPSRELIVRVRYLFAQNKYKQALAVLCNSYPRDPQERFLFGELVLLLMLAVARLKTGDSGGAAADFEKAYELSFSGEFEMPFVELGKSFGPLAAAAARSGGCRVPAEWISAIERKAAIYAKKTAVIANSYRKDKKVEGTVLLSERELEVLEDLYHGLSREEIAAHEFLSVNTVKKILQSIYIKLDANNNVDAIRIALERNLIE